MKAFAIYQFDSQQRAAVKSDELLTPTPYNGSLRCLVLRAFDSLKPEQRVILNECVAEK
jgi:hypothetical protein